MRLRSRSSLVIAGALGAAVAAALVVGFALAPSGAHRHRSHRRATLPSGPVTPLKAPPRMVATPVSSQNASRYLSGAETGYARARAWWDPKLHWYLQYLPGHGPFTLATMWGIVHLFGATNAIAIADPTPAHVAAARAFAGGAERYWNPELLPVPGYSPKPGDRGPDVRTWFDDEAWWAVAFFDAFRATGDRHYLGSAARALRFTEAGWKPGSGGIRWEDRRGSFDSTESLAGATLTAAALYQQTHDPADLAIAQRNIAWANRHIRGRDGLYGNRSTPANPMAYIEGPMAEAMLRLCNATGRRSWCNEGEQLIHATAARFKVLDQGPQYDSIYIRSLLEIYRMDHNPRWYAIATAAGNAALAHAQDRAGLYMRMWDGRPMAAIGTPGGKLQTHAATTSLLAWLAAAKPPGTR